MHNYIQALTWAVMAFPVAALVLAAPYAVHEYRRVGSVPAWRTFVVYTLLLYLICTVFVVLLPLPPSRTADYGVVPQLRPFDWVVLARRAGVTVDLAHPRTVLAALENPNVYGAAFNVAMLVPWGFYLRYLFKRRWWQALFLGFGLSLSFELTQLTGTWGLYAHPYRHFDVDDLVNNTLGTMVGFWGACLMGPLLPSLEAGDERALQRNLRYPPLLRRALALAADLCSLAAGVGLWTAVQARLLGRSSVDGPSLALAFFCVSGLLLVLLPVADGGRTPGALLCKLRVRDASGARAGAGQLFARQALLWWVALGAAVLAFLVAPTGVYATHGRVIEAMVVMASGLWALSVLARAFLARGGRRPYVSLPGFLSRTRVLSLAQVARLQGRERR